MKKTHRCVIVSISWCKFNFKCTTTHNDPFKTKQNNKKAAKFFHTSSKFNVVNEMKHIKHFKEIKREPTRVRAPSTKDFCRISTLTSHFVYRRFLKFLYENLTFFIVEFFVFFSSIWKCGTICIKYFSY